MKNLFIKIFCLFSVLFAPSIVLADGMIIEPRSGAAWDDFFGEVAADKTPAQLSPEDAQLAFIDWDSINKREKMMIVVDRSVADKKEGPSPLYWIVPIKSSPESVTPFHYNQMPTSIDALLVEEEASNRRNILKKIIWGLQVWPLFGQFVNVPDGGTYSSLQDYSPGESLGVNETKTYKKIQSDGVLTEILAANSISSLKNYLANEGIALTLEHQDILQKYVGAGYCFAVSKVIDSSKKSSLGLMLEFDSPEPFYPLLISSVYQKRKIRMEVFAGGVFDAFLGDKMVSADNIDYFYVRDDFKYGEGRDIFFHRGKILTRVKMNTPAFLFTGDLFFRYNATKNSYINLLLGSWLIMLLFFVLLSLILAKFIFKRKWLLAAFSNIFAGVLGLIFSLVIINLIRVGKMSLRGIWHHSRESRLDVFGFLFRLNRLIIFLMAISFLLILLSFFGVPALAREASGLFSSLLGDGVWIVFLLFALPVSFLISFAVFVLERIASAHDVPVATRSLLAHLLMMTVNFLEFVLFLLCVILFFSLGIDGVLIGASTIAILLWFIVYHRRAASMAKIVLTRVIYLFFLFGLLDISATILSVVLLYPYLICYYYASNISDVSRYLHDRDLNIGRLGREVGDGRGFEHSERVAAGIALYSIILVIVYYFIDVLVGLIL